MAPITGPATVSVEEGTSLTLASSGAPEHATVLWISPMGEVHSGAQVDIARSGPRHHGHWIAVAVPQDGSATAAEALRTLVRVTPPSTAAIQPVPYLRLRESSAAPSYVAGGLVGLLVAGTAVALWRVLSRSPDFGSPVTELIATLGAAVLMAGLALGAAHGLQLPKMARRQSGPADADADELVTRGLNADEVAALLRELRRSRPAESLLVAGVALMALAAALAWS